MFVHVTGVPTATVMGFGVKPAVPEALLAPTGMETAVPLGVGVGDGDGAGVYEELPQAAERQRKL